MQNSSNATPTLPPLTAKKLGKFKADREQSFWREEFRRRARTENRSKIQFDLRGFLR